MNTCPKCQQLFDCNTNNSCWCFQLPPLLESQKEATCLCSNCLKERIQNKIQLLLKEFYRSKINKAVLYKDLPVLKEYDYTIENDLWIFTSWYLLRRGFCCGNNCRNCPYE